MLVHSGETDDFTLPTNQRHQQQQQRNDDDDGVGGSIISSSTKPHPIPRPRLSVGGAELDAGR